MITFYIDELTPCLKSVLTGEIYETEVLRLKRKSYLSKFNKRTGWYVNWSRMPENIEIYALVLKGTTDIQGLIGLRDDRVAQAVYIHWACTAPDNNVWQYGRQKFTGVGGHLFAIAAKRSVDLGYEGFVHAEAMDKRILEYYVNEFGAESFPRSNYPYHFILDDKAASKIMEVYNYEWTDEVI